MTVRRTGLGQAPAFSHVFGWTQDELRMLSRTLDGGILSSVIRLVFDTRTA
jgi:hypothetical protein